jgi:hypothetical protein
MAHASPVRRHLFYPVPPPNRVVKKPIVMAMMRRMSRARGKIRAKIGQFKSRQEKIYKIK